MKRLLLPLITLLLGMQLMAQSELKTKSVSVFKNGKSFVIKEGKVVTDNQVYTLYDIPNALFGTLWFTGLQSDIVQVTSKQEEVEEQAERKANSFADLLYANKGKQITLTTHDDKVYTAIIEDFELSEGTNSVLHLKASDKWVSISSSSIRTVEFGNEPQKIVKLNTKTNKPVIKVQFAKGGNQDLSMMYLQNGISWTPSYLLELQSDTEARLKLQAEVSNDSEDITQTNMNFVVGVPNFKFANNAATLTSFIDHLYRETNYYGSGYAKENMFSNAIMTQVMGDYSAEMEMMKDEGGIVDNLEANASEDFYFYNINNVSLAKGARAHYPLFSLPVKIKHLYECNLPASQYDRNYRYYYDEPDFSFDTKQCNVFHSIEIKNDSQTPFTTGPVMIVDGKTQRPLSQDMIKYTGTGQTGAIQLSQSPDIRVEEKEKITHVKPQAKKRNSYSYSLVTIEGEVVITNSKKQDIEMSLNKLISGQSKTATVKYESRQTPGGSGSINPTDKLNFKLNVKAGQTLKFIYSYEMYVQD